MPLCECGQPASPISAGLVACPSHGLVEPSQTPAAQPPSGLIVAAGPADLPHADVVGIRLRMAATWAGLRRQAAAGMARIDARIELIGT